MAELRKNTHKSVDKIFDKAESIGESSKETIAKVKKKKHHKSRKELMTSLMITLKKNQC